MAGLQHENRLRERAGTIVKSFSLLALGTELILDAVAALDGEQSSCAAASKARDAASSLAPAGFVAVLQG